MTRTNSKPQYSDVRLKSTGKMASSGMGSGSAARAVSDAGAREARSDEHGAEAPDTKTSCSAAG
eukprot:CAMPEP_0183503766 /NCGR_PEP_ID=MMETSP0371-20130417/5357_1 /TAXON_ID=268820 /ORGANISM="Peridinium aciculiferum, Strain PAER-2" /LENGTH=63 /DNA_ID=CAMNT_0025698955 /DNA_START=29 /DNA_END=217 /DNA_ORIENTATION=-